MAFFFAAARRRRIREGGWFALFDAKKVTNQFVPAWQKVRLPTIRIASVTGFALRLGAVFAILYAFNFTQENTLWQ